MGHHRGRVHGLPPLPRRRRDDHQDVGNRVIVVDDETHDKAAAMISHMPHVVSTALINELVANPDRNIAAALAAGCWRDMTACP